MFDSNLTVLPLPVPYNPVTLMVLSLNPYNYIIYIMLLPYSSIMMDDIAKYILQPSLHQTYPSILMKVQYA